MRWSKVAFVFSILMIGTAIFTLTTKSLNWGLDFTGGTLIEVGFWGASKPTRYPKCTRSWRLWWCSSELWFCAWGVMVRLRPWRMLRAEKRLVTGSCLRLKMVLVSKLRCVVSKVRWSKRGWWTNEAGGLAILDFSDLYLDLRISAIWMAIGGRCCITA